MEETTYTKKDGFRAILLYLISCIVPVISAGILPQTRVSVNIIDMSQWALDLIPIILCLIFVRIENRGRKSIGISFSGSKKSIFLCIIGTIIIVLFKSIFSYIFENQTHLRFMFSDGLVFFIMMIGVIEEEIVDRAYMQTRLRGFIDNEHFVVVIASFLFLLSHYPVLWVTGQAMLPLPRVILLILLGLVCGIQFNKTHNVLVPIITHYIYNMANFY